MKRKFKAVLFIVMLAGARARHIQQDARFNTGSNSQSGDSGNAASHALLSKQLSKQKEMAMADKNLQKWATLLYEPTEALKDDLGIHDIVQLIVEGVQALMTEPVLVEMAKLIAERMHVLLAHLNLQGSPYAMAEQSMATPNLKGSSLKEHAERAAEHMEAMMGEGRSKDEKAKRTAKQMDALLVASSWQARRRSNFAGTWISRACQPHSIQVSLGAATRFANFTDCTNKVLEKAVGKLSNRALAASPHYDTGLDQTLFGKPSRIPSHKNIFHNGDEIALPTRRKSGHFDIAYGEAIYETDEEEGDDVEAGTGMTDKPGADVTGVDGGELVLSSVTQTTVNLIKSVVGAGMLSLPAGVAAFSGSPKALVPAFLLILITGLMSAKGFVLIADACWRTHQLTYAGAWGKTVSFSSQWVPAFVCLVKTCICCVAYSMVLGDCLHLVLMPLGLPAVFHARWLAMLAITVIALFPLCSMKSLASLAKFSVLGVLSNVYICFFVLLRCFDGSYRGSSALLAATPRMPKFTLVTGNALGTALQPGVVKLISILSITFLAHYNAPFFWEEQSAGPDGNKLGRFTMASVFGFLGSGIIFSIVMVGGFLTFGSNSAGLILNNYAPTDWLATPARLGVVLSVLTAYPLVFLNVRKQFISMLGKRAARFDSDYPPVLTIALLSVITLIATHLRNLGNVMALAGAVFGNFLIYIAPALMSLRSQQLGIGPKTTGLLGVAKIVMEILMILLGLVLTGVGALTAFD